MKVLYVNNVKINGVGGGAVGSQKFLTLLLKYKNDNLIDDVLIFSLDNFPSKYNFHIKKNRFLDILARVFGKSNYLYFYMLKYKRALLNYSADVLILQNSRLGFFAKFYKKHFPKSNVFCHFDNIEFDYCKEAVGKTARLLESCIVKKDENEAVTYSDALLFLTKRDSNRCDELYKTNGKPKMIFPVCLPLTNNSLTVKSSSPTLIFLGSLNYEPNKESVLFFAKEIFPYINNKNVNVIVAGKNPDMDIKNICKSLGFKLFPDFKNISDFCPVGSALLSPIKKGFGMKTKIAEAFSYGMFVIGSKEALVGYESSIGPTCVLCNDKNDYLSAINLYCNSFSSKGYSSNKQEYLTKYSCDAFYYSFYDFLNSLVTAKPD